MNMNKIGAGALGGLVAAIVVDLHAWTRTPGAFDWSLAGRRWVAGAMAGVLAALGLEPLT